MKRIIKSLTIAAALAAMFAGCHRDESCFEPGNGEEPSVVEDGIGYISFAKGGLNVEWGGENVNTRAEDDIYDDWMVKILRVSPEPATVAEIKYEIFKVAPYGLPVNVGDEQATYQVVMYDKEMEKGAEWDAPTYSGETSQFSVSTENTPDNPLELEINITLASIKTTVWLEQSMAEIVEKGSITPTFEVKVFEPDNSSNGSSLTYGGSGNPMYGVAELDPQKGYAWVQSIEEVEKAAYFKPVVKDNAITLHIEMDYKGKTVKQDLEICKNGGTLAHAGESRRILLYIVEPNVEQDPTGNIVIEAKVETWMWNKEVVADVVSSNKFSKEPAISDSDDDPDAPVFAGSYKFEDGRASVTVSDADYDSFDEYQGEAKVTITAQNDITGFTVQISSTDAAYQAVLNAAGLTEGTGVDIVSGAVTRASAAVELVKGYGFVPDRIKGNAAQFTINGFMQALKDEGYTGKHTVTMTAVDADGHKSSVELVVTNGVSGGNNGPGDSEEDITITWGNRDMSQYQPLTPDLDISVEIYAKNGIKSFVVQIIGLELDGMLPKIFDLTDPNNYELVDYDPEEIDLYENLEETLGGDEGLGFPVKDKVKNQNKVTFSVAQEFVALLADLEANAKYAFKMTVTDNNGSSIMKSILLECK